MSEPTVNNSGGKPLRLLSFAWRGRMSHDLTEQVPGAPSQADETDLNASLIRLRRSSAAFQPAQEPL